MSPFAEIGRIATRRTFLRHSTSCLGAAALAALLNGDSSAPAKSPSSPRTMPGAGRIAPRAKRVIFLFMSGGPSHMDLFDPKPMLTEMHGKELPPSIRQGQRITRMTQGQKQLLCVAGAFKFIKAGKAGFDLAETLPHTARIVDDICMIRSMHTEPINHDPAVTMFLTGNQQAGRPSVGSWVSYGLGSVNKNLPEFIVLLSGEEGQPFESHYWGNGFLPGQYQGVQFRSAGEPVLYVSNPPGINAAGRRRLLDAVQELNRIHLGNLGDPEIATRISSYEMAYRMQSSVPELMDVSQEPRETRELYGAEPGKASFANNCLLARRLAERDVRFVQLFHRDWDNHNHLPGNLRRQCELTDRATAALIIDLKRRGMLEDTLVIWGGEFGRTAYCQGKFEPVTYGRDHHPRCFTLWMAGGGVKPGMIYGKTDDFGYNIVENGVHVHDFQATVLHLLGIDHTRLTYPFQGRDFRLTDVGGQVVNPILA
jgi:hypothetical protein